ncbi:peptidylprolyl isomerase [Polynucleobacter sp. MG-27-Goln-C1]|uniref:peptidylprolyl isomerase n=1 Tax=Polynucleobacter sp. MG-27-Goln-C1 TaxID=1819726 RepID=UPI001C0DF17E|nr:peptidylprolyl isomerase [Polynucleobacter sp. MG-27-Goln-C1]MBU3613203.1 peptidylprolyl isomerase [Polynucleobacter sp. MG-27-Goln-C1]
MKCFLPATFIALVGLGHLNAPLAQTRPDAKDVKPDYEFVATVNGTAITQGLLNLNIRALVSQGQRDTPELRQAIKEDLINKELIAQEATKQGLAKEIDFPDQITQLKQNLLLQAYLEDHFKKNPITDARQREEYDRQRKLMGDGGNSNQYRVSQIVVSTETDAVDLIRRVQKGELFGKLAQEYSIDQGSKAQGGALGWVMPGQVIPAVANVLPSMAKGAITTMPIQTPAGWVILRLDDKRAFKVPSFEEAKPQLRQAIVQQYLAEAVKTLRASARIVQ